MNATETKTTVLVVDYLPEHQPRFKEINVEWITEKFIMEEEDIKTVDDPDGYILKGGGTIYIALHNGYPVGTCAYLNMGNGVYEMIKMAVDKKYRGLKIGWLLGIHSVQKMKEFGAKQLILFSNTNGSAEAVKLYHKLGFHEIPLGQSEFQRANIKMELNF